MLFVENFVNGNDVQVKAEYLDNLYFTFDPWG